MAAPTSVRVEATSQATTSLFWVYAGANPRITVYRSTDGISYSAVGFAEPAATVLTFEDTGLVAGTKYWYKVTDDDGATFSSVVTTHTHSCIPSGGATDQGSMPRFNETDEEWAIKLNEMAERIERAIGDELPSDSCVVCPNDGAIVIDCSQGCTDFTVIVDEDINSVTINWCDEGTIEPICPPNETCLICGFPAGFGFTGDECFQAPLAGGTKGRKAAIPFGHGVVIPAGTRTRQGYGDKPLKHGGLGGGGTGCICTPGKNGELAIKCCSAKCSAACTTTKSLRLIACGGRPPYTWTKSGGDGASISQTEGNSTTVTPATNTGGAVAGIAYKIDCRRCTNTAANDVARQWYTCGDVASGACTTVDGSCAVGAVCDLPLCVGGAFVGNVAADCCGVNPHVLDTSTCQVGTGTGCDVRTAPMIAAGCKPCGISLLGLIVTVTDSVGVAVSVSVKP